MKQLNNLYLKYLIVFMLISGCVQHDDKQQSEATVGIKPGEEIFYLIFPRSFYDSDGDRIGDLNGITKKLDYIQSVGVTSIIMTPLYPSSYYHNYFTNDFFGIDPEFGTMDDYLNMIKEIHGRGMKFYMDTELQYTPVDHPWVTESYKNPDSEYSNYILYQDSLNMKPERMIWFNMKGLKSYDGFYTEITTVNLNNSDVRKYITDYYKYWIDPNKDGVFDDGVDGFRLDSFTDSIHDHVSGKNIFTNLTETFWKPIIDSSKQINPNITFVAEQATWDDGDAHTWMKNSGVEVGYSFGLHFNLMNPAILKEYFKWSNQNLPEGKNMFAFLDQHDTDRVLSRIADNTAKNKQLATLAYLTKFIPYIYYGQEIGMSGKLEESTGNQELNDGQGIPVREPFEWTADINAPGMALWFENVEPYWGNISIKSDNGISVEEQNVDPNSLLNFYRNLLKFRSSKSAITKGNFEILTNSNDSIFAYARWDEESALILVFNFGPSLSSSEIHVKDLPFSTSGINWENVFGDGASDFKSTDKKIDFTLVENGFIVVEKKYYRK